MPTCQPQIHWNTLSPKSPVALSGRTQVCDSHCPSTLMISRVTTILKVFLFPPQLHLLSQLLVQTQSPPSPFILVSPEHSLPYCNLFAGSQLPTTSLTPWVLCLEMWSRDSFSSFMKPLSSFSSEPPLLLFVTHQPAETLPTGQPSAITRSRDGNRNQGVEHQPKKSKTNAQYLELPQLS